MDCGQLTCGGERAYAVSTMVALHGNQHTVGALLLRLRCRMCGQPPKTVFIETGPVLTARGQLRCLALFGPDDDRQGRNS